MEKPNFLRRAAAFLLSGIMLTSSAVLPVGAATIETILITMIILPKHCNWRSVSTMPTSAVMKWLRTAIIPGAGIAM